MKTQEIPYGYNSITPYITVRGAEKAIEFYKKAFGAKDVGQIKMPDGTIGHCELEIGDRSGSLTDPFGHRWTILTHLEDVSFQEMQKRSDALFKG